MDSKSKKLKQNGVSTSLTEAVATSIKLDDKNLWVHLTECKRSFIRIK